MFEEPLKIGPFVVNSNTFKELFDNKWNELSSKVFNRVKKSVIKTCTEIEVEVESAIEVLDNRNLRDIQELVEVREFVKQLPEAGKRIGGIIKEVYTKLGLLDKYKCKRSEEEIQKTWRSFAEPLRIREHELDCKLYLERMEKEFF